MPSDTPPTCSLEWRDLERRLAAIAAVGGDHLRSHEYIGGRHLLRFQATAALRPKLAEIVEAESCCCPFLDLEIVEADGEVVLSVSADEDARSFAGRFARAFGTPTA